MKVALFIPCYIDQFYPQVGVSTLELLEKLGVTVEFPMNQTCCGQPMANAGYERFAKKCNDLFIDNFEGYEYIVCPSGSCVLHIKEHLKESADVGKGAKLTSRVFELCEFLTDQLHIDWLDARFPYKVGLHQSCHGQRGLHLSQSSEIVAPYFSKPEGLLKMVAGLQLVSLDRRDECCGFGGTFSVSEESVAVKMGKDRVADHVTHGAEVITATDMSCLMHLEGILRRQGSAVRVKHIAEILNASLA